MKRKLYYIANFEKPYREDIKDAARMGIIGGSVGGGALVGSELGTRLGMNILQKKYKDTKSFDYQDADAKQKDLNNIKNQWELEKKGLIFEPDDSAKSIDSPPSKNSKLFKKRRFKASNILGGGKSKLVGAGIGAIGGWQAATSLGNRYLPDTKYSDPDSLRIAQERRRELSHRNRSSEELRGWLNVGRRFSQL